ncbi:MAG: phosphohistidine phosphatase, partial [Thermoleophilaceae bacterium]|nr:phosphohistidine phosphatase [Thermoleophilaceae bacterium]
MLWLLRHAEAEDGSPDSERPLTEKGRRQAQAAGAALAALGVELDACLTSPKVRAYDTARLACEALGLDPRHEPKLAGGPFDAEQLAAGL